MKKYALLFVALATTLSLFAQDKYNRYMNVYINGELTYQKAVEDVDSVTFPLLPVAPLATPDVEIPSGTLTVPQANAICSTLSNGGISTAFYVQGWVKEIVQESDTTIRTFYLAEKMYADTTFGDATFLAYQVHYLKNTDFIDEAQLAIGDFVVIYGELTNSNGIYRTLGDGAYVYSSNNTRTIVGHMPKVEPTEGAVTVVWNIVDAEVCSELVFAGDYNGYNTDPSTLVRFEAIEGYEGWYKAVITPADASESSPVLAGKPCALAQDGTFPSYWDYQWIDTEEHPCEIRQGDAYLERQYDIDQQLLVNTNSSVVYIRSYAFKTDPCSIPIYENVTFNLHTTLPVENDGVVYIVGGGFERRWDCTAYPMTKIDANNWTITLPALINQPYSYSQYKYVVNGSWDNEMLLAPEGEKTCSEYASNLTIEGTLVDDEVYGFENFGATRCED